jgi:hypothetical protein
MQKSNARLAILSAAWLCVVMPLGVYAQEQFAQPKPKVSVPQGLRIPAVPNSAHDSNTEAINVVVSANGDTKTVTFGAQSSTASCSIRDASVTIHRDGTGSFKSQVDSTSSNDAFCTRIIFRDHNGLDLWVIHPDDPGICSGTLSTPFAPFEFDIAIPENVYQYVTTIWRRDHC